MDQIKWLTNIEDNAEDCPKNQLAWVGYGPNKDDIISLEDIEAEVKNFIIDSAQGFDNYQWENSSDKPEAEIYMDALKEGVEYVLNCIKKRIN